MALELTGSLIKKLPVQSGTSARGEWQKQEFVIQTLDTFPRQVCLNVWGADKVAELTGYNEGELIKVSFNVESREFRERWYTDLRAWKLERTIPGAEENPSPANPSGGYSSGSNYTANREKPAANQSPKEQNDDDMPFDSGADDLPF